MNILSTTFALLSGSLITLILDGFLSRRRRRRRFRAALPPSPKSLPLFGSFFSIPTKQPWKTYTTWARELNSELISVWAFGHLTIIISSAKAARELLSYRAANYGDRPRMPVLDLSTMSDVLAALMPYGERWRTHRRFLHRNFNLTTVSEYQPMQAAQIMHLLQDIYREPNSAPIRFTASLSFRVAYGLHMSDGQEQIAAEVVEANESVLDCTLPGASTVNIFPVLRYIPKWLFGASFHTIVHQCREVFAQVREESYTRAKASLVIEESTPSFMRSVLEDTASPTPSEERDVKDVAFQIFVGSAETTLPAICAVILALALYPDVQCRAQAELDMVTGRARLPTYDDKDALPYIEAIVRETLRWCPVTPVGVPRSTINDDVYEGMFIPAGTTVIWNSWAITHDPEVYPEPDAFYPDRYIDADGRVALDEDISIFGFGRRECPGMHFARNTLFLVTASILSLFDLSKIKDKDGNSVEIDADFTDGVVSHVKDFGCSIRPRDEQAVNLLNMIK